VPVCRTHDWIVQDEGALEWWPPGGTVGGTVGGDLTVEEGRQAARLSALNVLARARAALDGIKQTAKVSGFVNWTLTMTEVGAVVNSASSVPRSTGPRP